MSKNILLLFLSPVRTAKVGDEIVISEAYYKNLEGDKTKTTNESAVRYLLKENIALDNIFVFASEKVRGKISYHDRNTNQDIDFVAEDGEPRTHLQFFIERVKKFLPNTEFETYDYDEKSFGDENLKSVAKMARLIQNFSANEDVTLHVDLTGGMRHISMIMLELTRLLEYSGLKIGRILYSNYDGDTRIGNVEEIQNIYALFQLIAGVEEFVNFGSVKALDIYYKDKKISEPLRKLLTAMRNFADAIKLCHYWKFRFAIENLHDAVRDFKPAPNDLQDILMERFIKRIRKNYAKLIDLRDLDDLRVIRWCLKNGYLQQALTLYTERIPEYLGEKNFLGQSEDKAKILTDKVAKDEMGRNRFFYLFSEIKPKEEHWKNIVTKYQRHLKNYAWPAVRKKIFDFEEWANKLDKELNKQKVSVKDELGLRPLIDTLTQISPKLNSSTSKLINELLPKLKQIKLGSEQTLELKKISVKEETQLRLQLETFAKIFQEPKLLINLNSPELEPLNKLIKKILPELEKVKYGVERQKIIANFMTTAKIDELSEVFDGASFVKNQNAYKMYDLLVEGFFFVNIPEENFLSIADKYFRIKKERNYANHAYDHDASEFKTTKDLRDFMLAALNEIKENIPHQP